MSKKANLGNSRRLDQFYTSEEYARYAYLKISEFVDLNEYDLILEPSAGTGSFYSLMDKNKRYGIDLEPKFDGIVKGDFFDWIPPKNKKIISIGNPPFGKNANLAVKFFQKSSLCCDTIAFILPKTFRKLSIINRLNKNFHLVHDEDVPKNSFVFENSCYDVPCCLQIWNKRLYPRQSLRRYTFDDVKEWFRLCSNDEADFSVQRVGHKAGTIRTENFKHYSNLSHYYLKALDPKVIDIFLLVSYEKVKYNTAGNPSISPSELIELWLEKARECGLNV